MKFLKILAINIVAMILGSIIIASYTNGVLFGMNMAPFAIILFLPPVMLIINTGMFLLAKFQYEIIEETYIYGGFSLFWGIISLFLH